MLPAFNQEGEIQRTLWKVNDVLTRAGIAHELIVVSDGSVDRTASVAEQARVPFTRVFEYQPNKGKGEALRFGSAQARGQWIAWVDADLDLDPVMLPSFLAAAQDRDLDAVIGSKRHRCSDVDYPPLRRVYSGIYQAVVWVLFDLHVRDTQVGMKVFRAEVLARVLPLVLVKRYAFDLEVLSVAKHLGFAKMEDHPVILTYQFTGTSVNRRAVVRTAWDTLAVFYRLRLRRYYDE